MAYKTIYPPEFHRKVLALEAPGGAPAALEVVVPSVTKPGRPFEVKVAVLDRTGYPSLTCAGRVALRLPGGGRASLSFRAGQPAVGRLAGVRLARAGVFRLAADLDGLRAHSNPTACADDDRPGIYWGDPHVHTALSRCMLATCRSLNFCYAAARYLSALDWVTAADHVSNDRCDAAKWKEQRLTADLYDDPPGFVALPGYEASLKGGAGGDNNVYLRRYPGEFVDEYEAGDLKSLCRRLAAVVPAEDFFVVPHHTTRTGKHGEIPDGIYPGPEAMPLLEIHSKWGTSEYRGNPNPLQAVHPGPSYAVDLMNRGLKLGFVAGTDSHATMPSAGGDEPPIIDRLPGLTAVFCRRLSRGALFDALRGRRCYAASRERILLLGSVAGCPFGGERPRAGLSGAPEVAVLVAARTRIGAVDIVCNGKTVHTVRPGAWRARVTWRDKDFPARPVLESPHLGRFAYYYVRVTCESGAQAWSSPVWLT